MGVGQIILVPLQHPKSPTFALTNFFSELVTPQGC